MKNQLIRTSLRNAGLCLIGGGLLTACGIEGTLPESAKAEVSSALTACFTAWNSTAIYTGGATASYGGVNYTAAYWTQGDNPATNSGAAGSGKPWISGESCGSETPPPPPPPPPPACTFTNWSSGINYTLGTIVKYLANGNYYKLVNVGAHGSDGTDPTISTWYWSPTTCGATMPPPPPPPGGFVVTEDQFNRMFPSRSSFYTYAGLVAALSYYPAFAKTGTDTVRKQEAAAFLANVAHESDNLKAVREYNTANYPLYCSRGVGNCGGKEYYGRGPIQLSWDYNYKAAGTAMGVDLLNSPDLVATDSAIAWRTGLWYWMTGTGAAGTTPHEAMINSQGFGVTIRAINGSLECDGKRTDQVMSRVRSYTSFTGILGVPTGSNLSC